MAEKFGRKLKKYNRAGTALLAGILLASVNVRTAAASTLARGPAWESEQMRLGLLTDEAAGNTVFNGDVNTLKAAAEASQLIVAVGNEADPAQGTLTLVCQKSGREADTGFFSTGGQRDERHISR